MKYLLTRNRLGEPITTEMDEWEHGGGPTGKIVVRSKIVDGKYIPIYKGEEPVDEPKDEPEKPAKKKQVLVPNTQKFQKWINDRYGDEPMRLDPKAVASYNKWVEERGGTFADNRRKTEVVKPEGEEYEVFILEFDWHYGHERVECSSKNEALKEKAHWESTFLWTEFSNWKLSSEIRFRKELSS